MRWSVTPAIVARPVVASIVMAGVVAAGVVVGSARADEPISAPGKAKDADMFEPFNQKECDYPAPCGCNCDASQAGTAKPPLGDPLPGAGRPDRR